ncbi:transcriptional regulator with XRE-family HTH domain [Sagittula marina]|uniref:Transcriptional regulator with XRE-family HTH domain n=1 Tax=Sagittula marina TaxID=943940 RepID=A0A7W6DS51_9RHOB|nr:helix-turn-helix transcriptional regulator [Sagittula marina]MBB3987982.1 transcriptional regulator with XRE-family HTH domain [Sagittula marina]
MAFKFTPVDPDEYARAFEEEEEAKSQEEALAAALAAEPHANLERFRRKRGFTKTEMAEMMDVTPRSYYAYESGKRSIPTEALVRLNMYTGVDLNEILTGRPSSEGYERVVSTTIWMLRVLMTDYKGIPLSRQEKIISETICYAQEHGCTIDKRLVDEVVASEMVYKYHSENIPAPPDPQAYSDDQLKQYKEDQATWEARIAAGLEGRRPSEEN